MAYEPKILAFAGSLRKDSYNKKLVKIAVQGALEAGAKVTYIDLREFPLPFYDQEIEDSEGLPSNAMILKKMMWEHDGFLLACPEYNSSMSAVFKNTIDWTSRKATPDETFLSCFIDKAISLMSASPSPVGGLRGLVHVRSMFSNLFTHVLPDQKCIGAAYEAFDEKGQLKSSTHQEEVMRLGSLLTQFIREKKDFIK